MVDCGGLENRCAARHPGFESLSLRNKGCKSSICEIYTLFYTQECKLGVFFLFNIRLVMMTTVDMDKKQYELEKEISNIAQVHKLTDNGNCLPIYDGIGNFKEYLKFYPKIACLLKEPYDEEVGERPSGGGWSISRDCFMNPDQKWSVITWQRIIYTVFGLREKLKYEEMDFIRDDHSMGEVLRSIAWINLSKMPARKQSSNEAYVDYFKQYWKNVVKKQLEVYSPNVVICGGVFDKCKNELFPYVKPLCTNPGRLSMKKFTVYEYNGTLVFDVVHPGVRGKSHEGLGYYINSINEIIIKYFHLDEKD